MAALTALAGTAAGQWQLNGAPVSTVDLNQQYPAITADGAGDYIITWYDYRNVTTNQDIYAQRVSATGAAQWTVDGLAVCKAAGYQQYPRIVSDGSGGAIIAWHDARSGGYDIYAQRIDAAGSPQWTANGVAICTASNSQQYPLIISDDAGGAIIAWYDYRSGAIDFYAQRVDANGAVQWTANGVAICAATGSQLSPVMVSDGAGGAIIAWQDGRNVGVFDIYAQRVDATGTVRWATDGVAVCAATDNQYNPAVISDGGGGAFITWHDYRSGTNYDIYAQRLNASGVAQWAVDGMAICAAANNQTITAIIADGLGGAIITWGDSRVVSNQDIYAQRVNSTGSAQWAANGVAVCAATGPQSSPVIVSDNVGGAIIAWYDERNGGGYDLYAQRVDPAGSAQWAANGVAVCQATNYQYTPVMAQDGAGGAILAWYDMRSTTNYDIYAQRIGKHGRFSEPVFASLADVPNDQGGLVELQWDASCVDALPGRDVKFYSVWRDVDVKELDLLRSQGATLVTIGQITEDFQGQAYRADGKGYYWYWLGNVAARQHEGYSFPAPTLCDSGPSGKVYHYFMVSAQTADSGIYWDSEADSGYSVDNIAPTKALLLEGRLLKGPKADVRLDWNRETAADLWRYGVYRDVSSGFTPGPGNLVCYSDDTTETDAPAAACWYKVTAFDIHGNEGAPSNEWYYDGSTAVQLSMFAAMELEDGRVSVRWRTESEENCLRWEVERSADQGGVFQAIGSVPGQGSSTQPTDYRYDDESVLTPGTYYYRLCQVDLDGGKRYFGPVSLAYRWLLPDEAGVSGARPNPFNQMTTINYQITTSGPVSLKVYNVYGQLVRTLEAGTKPAGYHRTRWDGRDNQGGRVSAGVYLVRLEGEGVTGSARVAVVR